MKDIKNIIYSALLILIYSCFSLPGSPMTNFVVKNTSDKPISFKASIIRSSQNFVAQEITSTFTIKPHDSTIVRQTNFKKDGKNPQRWFSKFNISKVDGIEMNNPNDPLNWKKSLKDNTPSYTFTINK